MNKTFMQLSESAVSSRSLRLDSSLTQRVKDATERFNALAKTAGEMKLLSDEEHIESFETIAEDQRAQTENHTEPELQNVGWGYSTTVNTNSGVSQRSTFQVEIQPDNYFNQLGSGLGQSDSLVRRRQFTVGEVLDQSRFSDITVSPPEKSLQLPFGLIDILEDRQATLTPPDPVSN